MLAAARKYKRVVQVGTQRRSTPHLIEARDQHHPARASSARSATSRSAATTTCAPTTNPPDTAPPANLDYEMWTGPAPMRPVQLARASAQLARVHGIRQRHRRRHVRPHARHGRAGCSISAGRRAISFDRRHSRRQEEQGEHHRHADRDVRFRRPEGRLEASHLGRRARSEVSVGRDLLRRQGHAEGERDELRLHARRAKASRPSTRTSPTSWSKFPEDKTEKDLETPRRAGDPRPHEGFPRQRSQSRKRRSPTSSRATSRQPPASWPTSRCSWAARSRGIPRRAWS